MIRILRLMEYTYVDAETAEDDMSRWQIPANGTRVITANVKKIKSATITDLDFHEDD